MRQPAVTIGSLLGSATRRLATLDTNPRLDSEVLLAHVLGKSRSHLYAWPDATVAATDTADFESLVARRAAGTPVAYLTGKQEFWSLPLGVSADTLIPRPETELLVETALKIIPVDATWTIADLGTGSGAIALSIAHERPGCRVFATDISHPALEIAARNARQLNIENVSFMHSDWCHDLPDTSYDLVVSNPPYIAEGDPHLDRGDVRFEPHGALTAGPDGLRDLRGIIHQAHACLADHARLILEHGHDQGPGVRRLFVDHGYREILTHRDLAGHQRVTLATRPAAETP